MSSDEIVRARIDPKTKRQASKALAVMGLTVSDAIRLLMRRIADEKRLPFDVRVPNKETVAAIEELESGGGERYDDIDALLRDDR